MKKFIFTLSLAFFLVMPFFAQEAEAVPEVEAESETVAENLAEGFTKLVFISTNGEDFPVYSYVIEAGSVDFNKLCNSNDTIIIPNSSFYVTSEKVPPEVITIRKSINADGGIQTWEVSPGNVTTFAVGTVSVLLGAVGLGVGFGILSIGAIEGQIYWPAIIPTLGTGAVLLSVGIPITVKGAGKFKQIK